jgi:NADH-quinone oxidoreductase subunit N
VITMVGGNLMALMQTNIKRLLAYSSIAHAGYLLAGLATGGDNVGAGMLFYLASYAFMTLGAFAVVTAISAGDGEADDLADWSGIAYRYPLLSVVMGICLFSLAGIPPMAGFFAKFTLFYSIVKAGDVPIVIIAVLASATSVYYYLKVLVYMYMKDPVKELPLATPNAGVIAAAIIAALVTIYLGVLPGYVLDLAKASFASIF